LEVSLTVPRICGVCPEEKKKATVGKICRKGRFQAWSERVKDDESGELMEVFSGSLAVLLLR